MRRLRDLLATFSRVTSSGRFIPEIDGLRFVAVILVMLFHLNVYLKLKSPDAYNVPVGASLLDHVTRHGNYGVELFFALSGFILALPFAASALNGTKPPSLNNYFLRRLTRLEPPYVICLLGFYLMHITLRHQVPSELFPHLLASLFYSHNLAYGEHSAINVVAWSLEIEVQFYVVAPLLACVFALRNAALRRGAIVTAMAAATALSTLVAAEHPLLCFSILNHLQYFLAGFLLTEIFIVEWKQQPKQTRWWDVVGIAAWAGLPVLWASPTVTSLIFAPYIVILYCSAFRGTLIRRLVSNPWITTIGGMCYSIYLLHNYLTSVFAYATRGWAPFGSHAANFALQVVLVFPPVLGVSALFFILFEKPCMRRDWPQRTAAVLSERFAPLWRLVRGAVRS